MADENDSGRPVTFVVTQHFLDHFGLESAKDLPGLKELKSAGLLESTIPNVKETGEGSIMKSKIYQRNLDQPELLKNRNNSLCIKNSETFLEVF